MSYYKTNDSAVMESVKKHKEELASLFDASKKFADYFGGKHVCTRDFTRIRLCGVKFKPVKDFVLWTKPCKDYGTQRPRSKAGAGATEEQKIALKTLMAEWIERSPKHQVELEPLYNAFGTNWGELVFAGIGYFENDGYLYVETSAKLGPQMSEILGSEYMLAKEASTKKTAAETA